MQMIKIEKGTRLIVTILILLAVFGLIFGYFIVSDNRSISNYMKKENIAQIPTILTSIPSSEDGNPHQIKIEMSVQFGEGIAQPDSDALYHDALDVVSQLDYSKIVGKSGNEYIKDEIKNNMRVQPESIVNVYVTDLQTDNAIVNAPAQNNSMRKRALKSLFPNIQ